MKSLLTILITTYNRAPFLDTLLNLLHDYRQRGLCFAILVSDDHSTDATPSLRQLWLKRMPDLQWVTTASHGGMDLNFKTAYEACTTDYCWLLGDARYISFEAMATLLKTIEEKRYDALILHCHPAMALPSTTYTNINRLLSDHGWHITNNASCVIPTTFAAPERCQPYMGTTFLHMGIVVDNLCRKPQFKVRYMANLHVHNLEVAHFTKQSWTCHPFLNFGRLWYKFIMSLPKEVDDKVKHQVLLDHNRFTRLFAPDRLPGMKVAFGRVFVENYKNNRSYVPLVSTHPLWIYDLIILWLPTSWLTMMLRVFKYFHPKKTS